MLGYLRQFYGGSGTIAEKIMQNAGFEPNLYSNEPNYDNNEPFKANRITNGILGEDDGKAGGIIAVPANCLLLLLIYLPTINERLRLMGNMQEWMKYLPEEWTQEANN